MFCECKSIYTYNQYHRRATCWLPQGTVTHTFFNTINIIVMKILVYGELTNKQVSFHPISWRKALLVFAVMEIYFFFHSSFYGVGLDLWPNSTDNTPMFSLLLSTAHTASGPSPFLALPHQRMRVHPGQLTPPDQRDIPYHMTLWSAAKAEGKKQREQKVH